MKMFVGFGKCVVLMVRDWKCVCVCCLVMMGWILRFVNRYVSVLFVVIFRFCLILSVMLVRLFC